MQIYWLDPHYLKITSKCSKEQAKNKTHSCEISLFREAVNIKIRKLKWVDTTNQLVDIFIKPLARRILVYLRLRIMGCTAMLLHGSMYGHIF